MHVLGVEAATAAFNYMEWCCAVGVIAVYAKVSKNFHFMSAAGGMTEIVVSMHGHRSTLIHFGIQCTTSMRHADPLLFYFLLLLCL